jgi:hypothetical protein
MQMIIFLFLPSCFAIPIRTPPGVTPTVMQIELSQDKVYEELLKIKPVKATGPNMVSPKLLKLAGKSIVPSLTSIFYISAQTTWKNAIVSAIYKKDNETERELSSDFNPKCTW